MNNENSTEETIDISNIKDFDSNILLTMGIMFALPSIALLLYGFIDSSLTEKLVEYASGIRFTIITALVCISMICKDANNMSKLGLQAPSKLWSLIPPVYFWKRSNILRQSQFTCFVFIGMAVFFTILEFFIFILLSEDVYYY